MADAATLLSEGLDHHNAGRLTDAAKAYRAILAAAPDHADAMHLLGLVRFQEGDVEGALDLVRAAVGRHPKSALFNANLGRIARAAGRPAEAVDAYRRTLAETPGDASVLSDFAAALIAVGDSEGARTAALSALRVAPGLAAAHLNLALADLGLGEMDSAEAGLARALALDPGLVEAHFGLGRIAQERGRPLEAEGHYRAALAERPDFVEALANLGNLLRERGDVDGALVHYDRALALASDIGAIHGNRAAALHEAGDLEGALVAYDRAVALAPKDAEIRRNRALALLLAGDWHAGFAEYEWRWKTASFAPLARNLAMPRWRGEPGEGRALFVHAEQGIGDTVQFARYVPAAAERGWRVTLEVPETLCPLFAGFPGVGKTIARGAAIPAAAAEVPLLSLPPLVGADDPDAVSSVDAYLAAAPERVAAWRRRIGEDARGRRTVGLCWAGDPRHRNDRARSMPATSLWPLLDAPGVQFFSLQFGTRAADAAELPGVVDLAPGIGPYMELAAAVAALDLVVAVDTGVGHLAGALGTRAWLLLSTVPDWRWGRAGGRTPWYPRHRLFRQEARGDWGAPVAKVRAALAAADWD